MSSLERLVFWLPEIYHLSARDDGTELFGELEPLRARCPQLICINILDFPVLAARKSRYIEERQRQNGWEVQFLPSSVNDAVWRPRSLESDDCWTI